MLIVMGQTGNSTLNNKAASSIPSEYNERKRSSKRTREREVLFELRTLLEEYSPAWYTEEHHRRLQSALRPKKKR
jgi:hypothetical protein